MDCLTQEKQLLNFSLLKKDRQVFTIQTGDSGSAAAHTHSIVSLSKKHFKWDGH